MKKHIILLISVLLDATGVFATELQEGRVLNSFMYQMGPAERADTYLSPLHYRGWVSHLGYEHAYAFETKPIKWQLNVDFGLDRTVNRVRNSVLLGGQFDARWAMHRRWGVSRVVELGAGGATTLDVGALYLSRNGNNPVAANASFTVDLSAYANFYFRIGRLPIIGSYQATLPLAGAMFAPEYGQLYYEIYLGDRHSIFSGAYWGRYFRLDQRVMFDLGIGPKWLRVGYECDVVSTKVNDIVGRRINHIFVLGITTDVLTNIKQ